MGRDTAKFILRIYRPQVSTTDSSHYGKCRPIGLTNVHNTLFSNCINVSSCIATYDYISEVLVVFHV